MSSVERSGLIQRYYPSLDGLRGAAILLVFCLHYGSMVLHYNWLSFGWVGVDIFFVLSGFLITGVLADTLGTPGALQNFYAKRALRIFPLYFAFWLLVLILHWPFHLMQLQPGLWRWMFYIGNIVSPGNLIYLWKISTLHFGRHGHLPIEINHFWSLCVEEQFYMVWPFALLLFRGRRIRLTLCILSVSASLAGRCWLWRYGPYFASHSYWAYHETFFRLDGLMLGAFISLLMRGKGVSDVAIRQLRALLLLVPGLVILAYTIYAYEYTKSNNLPFVADLSSRWTVTFGTTIIPLFATGVLLYCIENGNPISRAFRFGPLRALGKVSYGFYILHDLPQHIFIARYPQLHAHHLALITTVVWFLVSLGLARLSFIYFEMPFLRIKDRLVLPARFKRLPATSNDDQGTVQMET